MMPMPTAMNPSPPSQHDSAGGELVSVDGRSLPLVATSLEVEARGGLARVLDRDVPGRLPRSRSRSGDRL